MAGVFHGADGRERADAAHGGDTGDKAGGIASLDEAGAVVIGHARASEVIEGARDAVTVVVLAKLITERVIGHHQMRIALIALGAVAASVVGISGERHGDSAGRAAAVADAVGASVEVELGGDEGAVLVGDAVLPSVVVEAVSLVRPVGEVALRDAPGGVAGDAGGVTVGVGVAQVLSVHAAEVAEDFEIAVIIHIALVQTGEGHGRAAAASGGAIVAVAVDHAAGVRAERGAADGIVVSAHAVAAAIGDAGAAVHFIEDAGPRINLRRSAGAGGEVHAAVEHHIARLVTHGAVDDGAVGHREGPPGGVVGAGEQRDIVAGDIQHEAGGRAVDDGGLRGMRRGRAGREAFRDAYVVCDEDVEERGAETALSSPRGTLTARSFLLPHQEHIPRGAGHVRHFAIHAARHAALLVVFTIRHVAHRIGDRGHALESVVLSDDFRIRRDGWRRRQGGQQHAAGYLAGRRVVKLHRGGPGRAGESILALPFQSPFIVVGEANPVRRLPAAGGGRAHADALTGVVVSEVNDGEIFHAQRRGIEQRRRGRHEHRALFAGHPRDLATAAIDDERRVSGIRRIQRAGGVAVLHVHAREQAPGIVEVIARDARGGGGNRAHHGRQLAGDLASRVVGRKPIESARAHPARDAAQVVAFV